MFLSCRKEIILKCLIELTYWLQGPFHLEKNHDERIKRSALIWGAQVPYRQKPSILKKTHNERIERTTQKWSAQATHRQTSMIWNSVAACKELQQKWCYSLLWRDNVENVVTRCCNFSYYNSFNYVYFFLFSGLYFY